MPSFRSGRDQMQRIMNSIPAPPPPGIDITTAAPARMNDYWLGGHDHFASDRIAAPAALYQDTTARLAALGWPVCSIDTTDSTPGDVAAIVIDRILPLHADRSAHGGQ